MQRLNCRKLQIPADRVSGAEGRGQGMSGTKQNKTDRQAEGEGQYQSGNRGPHEKTGSLT